MLQDAPQLGEKAHVQHPVRLVEDEDLDLVEPRASRIEVVVEPARRGHDDLRALFERVSLRAHPHPADHHGAAQVVSVAEALHLLVNLQRQLAGGRQDQRAGAVLSLQPLEDGQDEGERLAGAGGGRPHHVLAEERGRDGLGLDGGGRLEALPLQRGQRLFRQAQFGERHAATPPPHRGGWSL